MIRSIAMTWLLCCFLPLFDSSFSFSLFSLPLSFSPLERKGIYIIHVYQNYKTQEGERKKFRLGEKRTRERKRVRFSSLSQNLGPSLFSCLFIIFSLILFHPLSRFLIPNEQKERERERKRGNEQWKKGTLLLPSFYKFGTLESHSIHLFLSLQVLLFYASFFSKSQDFLVSPGHLFLSIFSLSSSIAPLFFLPLLCFCDANWSGWCFFPLSLFLHSLQFFSFLSLSSFTLFNFFLSSLFLWAKKR